MQRLLAAAGADACIFVVGKGGVGKTTTAGALALAAADAGRLTHLVTTDPAESLSDLFGTRLPPGEPVASPCTDRLTLEAFDARAWGEQWLAPRRPALAEIIENGTYLERADVDGILGRTVPGVDEAMGALRIGRLAAARERGVIEHIVVDTAPTGHTLRLLDAGAALRGWVGALRAMAAKADVVASTLLHTPVRLAGERVLDEIEAELDRLDAVLRAAMFVIVHREDELVRAETIRLAHRLAERGLRVGGFVTVGPIGTPAPVEGAPPAALQLPLPWLSDPTGCAGMRALARGVALAAAAPTAQAVTASARPAQPERAAPAGSLTGVPASRPRQPAADWLRGAPWRLVWFAGKGGVGKSTCAAAAAVGLAATRAVSLHSTDPAGSLGELFGTPIGDAPTALDTRLRAQQVDAQAAFAAWSGEYRDDVARVFADLGLEQSVQLDRRAVESLLDLAPPGIDEIVSLDRILDSVERDETLIIDTAPTGHFLRLLEMPELALDWTHGLLRMLLHAGAGGSLDALSERVLAFAKRLKSLRTALADPSRAAVFVVTLDEPMVRAETGRLRTALRTASIAEAGVIINRARDEETFPDARVLRAPEMAVPPVGIEALQEFFDAWELV